MITVTVDPRQAIAQIDAVANDQFPFAVALSLTRMAQGYRDEVRAQLPNRFTIRTSWIEKGLRIEAATKRNLTSRVWHKDAFMRLQEEGGDKLPGPGKRSVAVPVGARPTPQTVTRPSQWPGRLKRTFFVKAKGGETLVLQRTGRRGKSGRKIRAAARAAKASTGRDPNLRLMYVLERRVRVKPRWGLREGAHKFAAQHYDRFFEAAWREANKPVMNVEIRNIGPA